MAMSPRGKNPFQATGALMLTNSPHRPSSSKSPVNRRLIWRTIRNSPTPIAPVHLMAGLGSFELFC